MKYSIIIPYYSEDEYLRRCLYSVKICSLYKDYEVIVVDDFSMKEVPESIKRENIDVKFLRNKKNLGFVRTCNRGAEKAKGEYLIFLNVDTEIISSGWLYLITDTFNRIDDTGVVGGKLIYPDTKLIQFAGGIIDKENNCLEHIYRFAPAFIPQVNKMREVDMITGAFLTVKKKLFNSLKGFSTDFHSTYEDADLCLRVKELGFKIIYQPDIIIYHYETVSGITDVHAKESKIILQEKWGEYFSNYKRKYYEEDGFSQSFITKLLKCFYNDFYNIFIIIKEFNLDNKKKQNDFIKRFTVSELLDYLIRYFKGRDKKIFSDLQYYYFKYYLHNYSKLYTGKAKQCIKYGENNIKKDEVKILLFLALGMEFVSDSFYSKKYKDVYNILLRIKGDSYKLNKLNFLYEKKLLIILIKKLNFLIKAVPYERYKNILSFFINNKKDFYNNDEFISLLFKLAYGFKGNKYIDIIKKILKEKHWKEIKRIEFEINFASYFEKKREYKNAIQYFEDILKKNKIKLSAIKARINYHLGYCNYMTGNYKEAEKYFMECLKDFPNHIKSNEYLKKLRIEKNRK